MVRGGHDYEFFCPVAPSDRITAPGGWRIFPSGFHRAGRRC
jgi:hypothetical protein